jgi:membrane-bound inhibitor of C-type lysozyme
MSRWLSVSVAALALLAGVPDASAQIIVTYKCRDGTELPVAFFRDERGIHLQVDGKALALPRRMSVSGARYAKAGVTFTIKGQVATLRRGGRTTQCVAD